MLLTLADSSSSYENPIPMSEHDGPELSGKFGGFLRKVAGAASTFAPPGASAFLRNYSGSPQLRPGGGQVPQDFQPAPGPQFTPPSYTGGNLPAVIVTPQSAVSGLLTPKNIAIGVGVGIGIYILYQISHKK